MRKAILVAASPFLMTGLLGMTPALAAGPGSSSGNALSHAHKLGMILILGLL